MDNETSSKYDYQRSRVQRQIDLVDVNKFIVLFVMSLGLYGIWWMYKMWKFFQMTERSDIMPAARAIFTLFFAYSLLERIKNFANRNKYPTEYNSGLLFVGFVLANMISRMEGAVGLISIFAFAFLIAPVRAFNGAIMNSEDYNGQEVDHYNGRQLLIIVFGVAFWSMILLAVMSGEF